jgi:N-acylglucosamine 2-epimerase
MTRGDLGPVLQRYRATLLEDVMPFWTRHALDREHGGLFTCIADDGTLQSRDKYMWSQLRALWTFSALCNELGPRDEWLEAAHGIYRFVHRHGRDEQGHWVYALRGDGSPHTGASSIYTDGFALYGLVAYARATGEAAALDLACETFERTVARLRVPGSYPSEPYPLPPGVKAHGISMIFSLAFLELARATGESRHLEAARHQAEQVMGAFLRPERRHLLEFLDLDDRPIDSPRGRAIVPGHAIESMWFMIHVYDHLQQPERIEAAIEAIRWHVELGWDEEYGGIVLARDAEGGQPWWPFADAKLWWPQTEALYALLLAYERTGAAWCLDLFERVDAYAFAHYPVPEHGEWRQRLDRFGRPLRETVALPVKDPFHLPRSLLYSLRTLERLMAARGAA